MGSINDIKITLFISYVVGYLLTVVPPVLLDRLLQSHVYFPLRQYTYAPLCIPIYIVLLILEAIVLIRAKSLLALYYSVCIFFAAVLLGLPIFLPEFPHGNVFSAGGTIAFLGAFSIFVWSISQKVQIEKEQLQSAGAQTFEYMKLLMTFVRQGAFAGVTLFGALFFAAYATGFRFVEGAVTSKQDIFLLNTNIGVQVTFYAIYAVIGPIRYFFIINLVIINQFREIATRLDREKTEEKGQLPK